MEKVSKEYSIDELSQYMMKSMLSVRFSYKIIIDDSAKISLSEAKPQRDKVKAETETNERLRKTYNSKKVCEHELSLKPCHLRAERC